jgi:hypothetical protein
MRPQCGVARAEQVAEGFGRKPADAEGHESSVDG